MMSGLNQVAPFEPPLMLCIIHPLIYRSDEARQTVSIGVFWEVAFALRPHKTPPEGLLRGPP
jgi:hypothetical protein